MSNAGRKLMRKIEKKMNPFIEKVQRGLPIDDCTLNTFGGHRHAIETSLRKCDYVYDADTDSWRLVYKGYFVEVEQ